MAKPNGAMSSPFTGFADQMKNSGIFGTIGTEQNLPTRETEKKTPVVEEVKVQPTVEASVNVNKYTADELCAMLVKLQSVGQIVSASFDGISVNINGTIVNIHK